MAINNREQIDLFKVAADGNPDEAINIASQFHGVDPSLIRSMQQQESGGDQSVISPKGARGRMQLMPDTALSLGVNPNDEIENIWGGVKYLSEQLKTFKGDVPKALAAYNAGPGAVNKYGGIPPYKETQAYVARVLNDTEPSQHGGLENLIMPITGTIAGGFGDARNGGERQHMGIDYAAPAGTPIYAPTDLEFVQGGVGGTNLRSNDRWAHYKIAGTDYEFRIAHQGELPPQGTVIKQGELMGTIGSAIDNPHLHAAYFNTKTGKYEDIGQKFGLERGQEIQAGTKMGDASRQKDFLAAVGGLDLGYGLSSQAASLDGLSKIADNLHQWAIDTQKSYRESDAMFLNTLANIPAIFNGLRNITPGSRPPSFENFEPYTDLFTQTETGLRTLSHEAAQEVANLEAPSLGQILLAPKPTSEQGVVGKGLNQEKAVDQQYEQFLKTRVPLSQESKSLTSQIVAGLAGSPQQIAIYAPFVALLGPVAGMAAAGALINFDKGIMPTIEGAVKSGVMGLGLGAISPMKSAQQAVAMGLLGAMQAMVEGGGPKEMAAGFSTMMALSTMGTGGNKTATEIIRDSFDQFQPKYQKMLDQGYLWRGNDPPPLMDIPNRKETQLVGSVYDPITPGETKMYSGGPETSGFFKKAIDGFVNAYKEKYGPITDETRLRWESAKYAWQGEKKWQGLINYLEERNQKEVIRQEAGEWTYGKKSQQLGTAILEYIDLKRNPDHYAEFLDQQPPNIQEAVKLFPVIEANPRLMDLVDRIKNRGDEIGGRALSEGVISNVFENYQNRIYDFGKEQTTTKFGTKTRHRLPRQYETRFQARADGLKYLVEDVAANQRILGDELANTIADKQLLKQYGDMFSSKGGEGMTLVTHPNFNRPEWAGHIKVEAIIETTRQFYRDVKSSIKETIESGSGVGTVNTDSGPISKLKEVIQNSLEVRGISPDEAKSYIRRLEEAAAKKPIDEGGKSESYKKIITELKETMTTIETNQNVVGHTVEPFRGRGLSVDSEGNIIMRRPLYAPDAVAEELNNIIGNRIKTGWLNTTLSYQATLKALQLSYSLFHAQAFLRNLMTNPSPGAFWNVFQPGKYYREGKTSLEAQGPDVELLYRNGLVPFMGAADWAEMRPGDKTIFGKAIDSWVATRKVNELVWKGVEANVDFTFQKLGNSYKTQSALDYMEYLRNKFPDKSPEEIAKKASNHANNVWGGLNEQIRATDPLTIMAQRLVLLARDWTLSNLRLFTSAFAPEMEGALARQYWMLALSKTFTATALLRVFMSIWDDKSLWERWAADYEAGNFRWLDVNITPLYKVVKNFIGSTPDEADRYFRVGGHFYDVFKMIFDTGNFIRNKGSLISRMAMEAATGKDWRGRTFTTFNELLGITGEPDQEPLKGKLTKEPMRGEGGAITASQMPSFIAHQARQVLPIPFQNYLQYASGELDGFDAFSLATGARVGRKTVQSAAEKAISDYYKATIPSGTPLTQEIAGEKRDIMKIITQERDPVKFGNEIERLLSEGKINYKQYENLADKGQRLLENPEHGKLIESFNGVKDLGAAIKIYGLANPAERQALGQLMLDKWYSSKREDIERFEPQMEKLFGQGATK